MMKQTLFISLLLFSCAEKRHAPTPSSSSSPSTKKDSATSSAEATSEGTKEIPASFLSSPAAKSFVRPDQSPASEGSLSLIESFDLNEDGSPEVLIVPGPRFCGTGGCTLPKIFQERDSTWQEISALQSSAPQSNEVSGVEVLSEVFAGYHSLKISRPAKSDWTIRFDGKLYQLAPEAPTSDRVSEAKAASLMLAGSRFDKARNVAPIGLWDKSNANKGAKISVQITSPSKVTFSLDLGVVGSPDEWHQAFFPVDFKGAPDSVEEGTYQVEYRLNNKLAASSSFTVK